VSASVTTPERRNQERIETTPASLGGDTAIPCVEIGNSTPNLYLKSGI
jgi:hypothetical protein